MSDLNEKEQAKIVRHFLLNSPPGQFSNVVRDAEQLIEVEGLVDRMLPLVSKRYNEEQMLVASVPDKDTKFLITKAGSVEGGYLEPESNVIVEYDHVKKAAGDVRDATEAELTPPGIAAYREKLSAKFGAHVSNFYPDGVSVVYGTEGEGGAFVVTACLSATKTNLSNRWSGRIKAKYVCTFTPGDDAVEIAGKLDVKVHYFEEGNVQLNTTHETSLKCKGLDEDEFGTTFAAAVEKDEQEWHKKMLASFADLSDNTFKHLRRKLPLTGKKFDFEHSDQYALGGEMKGGS